MSEVAVNILIGLLTSVLSGGATLAYRRLHDVGARQRKAAFFGLEPGGECLVLLNDNWRRPGTTSHEDVYAITSAVALAREVGCRVALASAVDLSESNGNRSEFCIGGPVSNPRTRAYLGTELPGAEFKPLSEQPDSGAIVAGTSRFFLEVGRRDYALVAKFTPLHATHPVFLVCGQTSIANHGAFNYLEANYRIVRETVNSLERFCIVLCIQNASTQGADATVLAADITTIAFNRDSSSEIIPTRSIEPPATSFGEAEGKSQQIEEQ